MKPPMVTPFDGKELSVTPSAGGRLVISSLVKTAPWSVKAVQRLQRIKKVFNLSRAFILIFGREDTGGHAQTMLGPREAACVRGRSVPRMKTFLISVVSRAWTGSFRKLSDFGNFFWERHRSRQSSQQEAEGRRKCTPS